MERRTNQILFALLRSAVFGAKLTEEERDNYSEELFQDLLAMASKHDVAHLLALGMKKNDLISKENTGIEKHILKAVFRRERLEFEYEKLCDALEKAQIPFLPLKGSVIRKYYPEPWMRTSCDIDILVHEEDTERAKEMLVDRLGYNYRSKSSHDLSFFTATKVHIELHYDLVEDGLILNSSSVLKTVWDTATVRPNGYWHEMPDEMFYFYHIAHMAKHLENGGCGVRPFLDLWILDHMEGADHAKRDGLLKKGELLTFANVARRLSRIWFGGEEHDPVTQQMENYILRGGVYGNGENRVAVQQRKKGGAVKYALSKFFLPYETLKFHYPILERYRWLMPIMQVRRWGKLIFCGHLRRSVKELRYNSSVSDAEAEKTKVFLENIGLM